MRDLVSDSHLLCLHLNHRIPLAVSVLELIIIHNHPLRQQQHHREDFHSDKDNPIHRQLQALEEQYFNLANQQALEQLQEPDSSSVNRQPKVFPVDLTLRLLLNFNLLKLEDHQCSTWEVHPLLHDDVTYEDGIVDAWKSYRIKKTSGLFLR
jgi:hypothetical protein